jgi:hypothetical protein
MNRKIIVFVLMILIGGLMAFHVSGQVSSETSQEKDLNLSIQQLKSRIGNLENQVATLQNQIKALEQTSPRVLTFTDKKSFPGGQIPPGARQHEIGGIKYWTIPLASSQ